MEDKVEEVAIEEAESNGVISDTTKVSYRDKLMQS
jgi:hypothetical protein